MVYVVMALGCRRGGSRGRAAAADMLQATDHRPQAILAATDDRLSIGAGLGVSAHS